jgi:hypothetical protein
MRTLRLAAASSIPAGWEKIWESLSAIWAGPRIIWEQGEIGETGCCVQGESLWADIL